MPLTTSAVRCTKKKRPSLDGPIYVGNGNPRSPCVIFLRRLNCGDAKSRKNDVTQSWRVGYTPTFRSVSRTYSYHAPSVSALGSPASSCRPSVIVEITTSRRLFGFAGSLTTHAFIGIRPARCHAGRKRSGSTERRTSHCRSS